MSEEKKSPHPRKLEIVQAAVTCFLKRGYHQTGVRDIARQAGVSLGNLYNHFKGKEAVLAFIADLDGRELAQLAAHLDQDDPVAALRDFLLAYVAYAARPENALLGAEIVTEALRNPVIADAFGVHRTGLVDALAGCLRAGADKGVFDTFDDYATPARLILDGIDGYGLRVLALGRRDDRIEADLERFVFNCIGAARRA